MAVTAQDSNDKLLLDIGSPCHIYSRSKQKWFLGKIKEILTDPQDHKEWLVVKYGTKTKKIQRFCNDIMISNPPDSPNNDTNNDMTSKDPRISLDIGSSCKIYSRSKQKWFDGKVNKIYVDPTTNKEWLIKYANNKSKKIQRFCDDLQINEKIPHQIQPQPQTSKPQDPRLSLTVGSTCYVSSIGVQHAWYSGVIRKIYRDNFDAMNDGLYINYGQYVKSRTIELPRNSERLRVTMDDIDNSPKPVINTIDNGWQQLSSPKFLLRKYVYSKIVAINEYEFVVATEISRHISEDFGGIYKYNTINNEWLLLIPYSNEAPIGVGNAIGIAYDKQRNELYVYSKSRQSFLQTVVCLRFNLDTKQYTNIGWIKPRINSPDPPGCNGQSIVIDSIYHMIGGKYGANTMHLMVERSPERCHSIQPWKGQQIPNSLVYMKSEQRLMVFGRFRPNTYLEYSRTNEADDDIWSYDLKGRRWRKERFYKMPCAMNYFGYVMTEDEKFVIFFGGIKTANLENVQKLCDIYVLDVDTMVFHGCTLKVPSSKSKEFNAVIMPFCVKEKVKLLIHGYVRKEWKMLKHDKWIPMDIISLISTMWSKDYVYLMDRIEKAPKLWKICIDDILDSMTCI